MADGFWILFSIFSPTESDQKVGLDDLQYRICQGLRGGLEIHDELAQSDFLLRKFDLGNDERIRQLAEEIEAESL